jgi:hypothetical protein
MSEQFTVKMTMRVPSRIARIWYRRLGSKPPLMETANPVADRARLVPYRFRHFHRSFAAVHGYYWIPCPLCGRPFGGHEGGDSIPNPFEPVSRSGHSQGLTICSQCTIRRNWRRR